MLVTTLEWLLWALMALFFIAWGVFAVRGVAFLRLAYRLSKTPDASPEGAERLARERVRVATAFFVTSGVVVVAVVVMVALVMLGD